MTAAWDVLTRLIRAVARSRAVPIVLLLWGVAVLSFLYGDFAASNHTALSRQLDKSRKDLKELAEGTLTALGWPHYPYFATHEKRTVNIRRPGAIAPGLTLISGLGPNGALFAKIVDVNGRTLHSWDLDWFRLWPHPTHLPDDVRPKSRPGTIIHGMVMEANGDLIFNFDSMGLMKVDFCNHPIWRLPLRTHHSVERDENGNYWVSGVVVRTRPIPGLPNHPPPIPDYSAFEVSQDGKVMREINVFDLLKRNGFQGALYLRSNQDNPTTVDGDMLHLNQVEVFPSTMAEGAFKHGDVLISLRNINSIVVFDPHTLVIRTVIFGRTVRQHDVHFVDGWTVSALDNNNVDATGDTSELSSRIVTMSVRGGRTNVLFEGTADHPFFTHALGKQQWLDNGDILVTEAGAGRALEVAPDRQIVWEYFNQTGRRGELGLLTQATRLPPAFPASKVEELAAKCRKN